MGGRTHDITSFRERVLKAIPSAPVARLSLQERSNRSQVALMTQEVGLFLFVGPEFDGKGQGIHCLSMAAYEGTPEINVLQIMFFRL